MTRDELDIRLRHLRAALTFHHQPVEGYTEELARRGELVYSCAVIGCCGDHPDHGNPWFNRVGPSAA
jgi:hypothetical protein